MPSVTRTTKPTAAKKRATKKKPAAAKAPAVKAPRKKAPTAVGAAKKKTASSAQKVSAAKKTVAIVTKRPTRVKVAATSPVVAEKVRRTLRPPPRVAPSPEVAVARASQRRTIFIDVENTSDEAELAVALEKLGVDRAAQPTEILAVGNWRVAGQRMGRRLASLGAQLVHSAPVTGVRDWSDLWIAVAAGMRLGRGNAGDVLEIISDDKAFDAVGDAAATLGIAFHRIALHGSRTPAAPAAAATKAPRRRRRGGRGSRSAVLADEAPKSEQPPREATVREAKREAPAHAAAEPHTATHEQILDIIDRLSRGDANRWVNLDVLTNELKREGFARPPGSPRLVTRLRKFADVEISAGGSVRRRPVES